MATWTMNKKLEIRSDVSEVLSVKRHISSVGGIGAIHKAVSAQGESKIDYFSYAAKVLYG